MLNELHKHSGKKDSRNEVNSHVSKFVVSHRAEVMGTGSKTADDGVRTSCIIYFSRKNHSKSCS